MSTSSGGVFDVDALRQRLGKLERETARPDLWNDREQAERILREKSRIEREVAFKLNKQKRVRLALREPDFTTAARIEAMINRAMGARVANMTDSGTVTLDLVVAKLKPARLIARIENLRVQPSRKARVVVDQRSGTIVLGADVKISRVAVSQGNLTIRISESPVASQRSAP